MDFSKMDFSKMEIKSPQDLYIEMLENSNGRYQITDLEEISYQGYGLFMAYMNTLNMTGGKIERFVVEDTENNSIVFSSKMFHKCVFVFYALYCREKLMEKGE